MLKEHTKTPIDPKRYAKGAETLEGSLPLSSFSLPREVLEGPEEVHFKLKFGIDSEQYVFIQGVIEATLHLECQRCLKPMEYDIHSEFQLSPVLDGNSAAALPERYEAVLMEQEGLSILRVIEDELILSLPIAPMHDKECRMEGAE